MEWMQNLIEIEYQMHFHQIMILVCSKLVHVLMNEHLDIGDGFNDELFYTGSAPDLGSHE